MIKKYVLACLLVMSVSGFVYASPKDRFVEISPKIATDESASDWTLGFSYDVNYPWSELQSLQLGEAESFVQLQLKGTVLEDKDLNNEALVSQVIAGFSLLGGQAVSPDFSPGMDPNAGVGASKDKSSWGYIYGGFNARHETIQSFDEQNLAAGFETGYINIRTEGLFSFIPSVIVAGEYVNGVASDIEEDTYGRFRAEASLKCAFGELLFDHKALMPFELRLDGRYNRAWDMDDKLKAADQDEVSYLAAALTYSSTMTLSFLKNPVFFIRYADGRIPPNTADERVVTAGVSLPVL